MVHPASDIESRLRAASLPALPQVLARLIRQCESDEAGLEQLGALLAQDAALAAKVLRIAASPAYRRGPVAASLEQAVAAIGTDMLRTMLLTESVYQTFNGYAMARGIDLRPFWAHSLASAVSARMLAAQAGYPAREEAYLAGLLHDVGRLALVSAAPEEYLANFLGADDAALCATEERTLEISHPDAGAALIEDLALDSFLGDAIRYHHEPLERLQAAHPLVRLTALADALAQHVVDPEAVPAELARAAGLSQEQARAHVLELQGEVAHIAGSIGIELPPEAAQTRLPRPAAPILPAIAGAQELDEQLRDLILVSKTADELRKFHDVQGSLRALVQSSVILFGFSDALVLRGSLLEKALTPVGLEEGRTRLAGLSLPLDESNVAGIAALHGGASFHLPPRTASLAEDQLLRFFGTEALVALSLAQPGENPLILLGATHVGQARVLQGRQQLLRDFGRHSGNTVGAVLRDEAQAAATAQASDFQLAARRVAHEVNNPLSIIRNYLSVLDRKVAGRQAINEELAVLAEEVDRVAQIVNDFASESGAVLEVDVDVNGAIAHVARMFAESGSLQPEVRIAHQPSREAVRAAMDPRVLNQILLNLVKNANEAMANGGRIDLRNHGLVPRDGQAWVALSVSDTGPGIPEDMMGRLFAPVPSAKDGPNRGLGLSIVHELVSKAGGSIRCRSSEAGTVFDILLQPAAPQATPQAKKGPHTGEPE